MKYENGEFIEENVISEFRGMQIEGGKGTLTDWGCRVPMFIYWHGEEKKVRICNDLIDFTDFLQTFLELAGLPNPKYKITGNSFAGLLKDENYKQREWCYSEWDKGYLLRTKNWKLISNGNLFYLPNDEYEKYPFRPENVTPESAHESKVYRANSYSIERSVE